MHLKGVHDRCVLIQNKQINVMLLIIISSPGLRSFEENVYLRGFISVWNLDVCTFSTFLGYVGKGKGHVVSRRLYPDLHF